MLKRNFFKRALSLLLTAVMISGCMIGSSMSASSAQLEETLPIYQDVNYTFAERATDLISRMTNEEKATQLNTAAPAIPRLGVRAYDWWREAIHGVQGRAAVSYPVSLSMSLSWDRDLLYESASIIGNECRAYFTNQFRWLGQYCPTVNMQRDPRWGRNEEGYGEDPYLVGEMGIEYVDGMQGNNDTGNVFSPAGEKYLKVMATPKHYAANNSEQNRYTGTSNVDTRTLLEYYTPQFRAIVEEAEPATVMTAYNRVNEIPAFAHTYLNNTKLRETWGFDGFIVSDCDGVANISTRHYWMPNFPELGIVYDRAVTQTEAAAFSLMGGTDLACNWKANNTNDDFFQDTDFGGAYSSQMTAAINQEVLTDNGVISWDDVDRALVRMFTKRIATGEFDKGVDEANLQNGWHVGGDYGDYEIATHVQTAENVASTLKASREGIVLLKNKDDILPLNTDEIESIAVIGKFLDHVELGASNYAGSPRNEDRVTFRQGITAALQSKGFDTEAGLKFYEPPMFLVSGNLFNLRDFTINGKTLVATSATQVVNCQIEADNIGSILDQSYAIFDLTEDLLDNGLINSFGVSVSTNGTGSGTTRTTYPVVELRLDGPKGELVGKIQTTRTASLTTYTTGSVSALNTAAHGSDRKLCLVFTTSRSNPVGFTETELQEIVNADVAIYYAGSTVTGSAGLTVSGENSDRANMNLPGSQATEIRQLIDAGAKLIVPIQAVGTMNITDFEDEVEAVLFTSYNGQKQGQALAEILVGDVNPTGRLSFTWYKYESQLPDILDYDIRPLEGKLGRTYQYFTGDVLYPFGYGLSYSDYEYSNMRVSKNTVSTAEEFTVSVDVENTSNVPGAEVVQVYLVSPGAGNGDVPFRQLKGFERVELGAKQKKTVTIELNSDDFWFIDAVTEKRVVNEGNYTIEIGHHCDDIKLSSPLTISGAVAPWLETVTLMGDKITVTEDQSVNTELTIALSDETFITVSQASVTYSSNRPNVADVDQNGKITCGTKNGTAVITAAVTYEGKTLTATYSVAAVVEEPDYDTTMKQFVFNEETFWVTDQSIVEYDVYVPNDITNVAFTAANVTASNPDGVSADVTLSPANGAVTPGNPCVATVKISSNEVEQSDTYTINFGRMTLGWEPDENYMGYNTNATVRFSDGKTKIQLFQAWYMQETGILDVLVSETFDAVPKHGSSELVFVYCPEGQSDSLPLEWLEKRTLSKFMWDSNYIPLLPADRSDWVPPVAPLALNDIRVAGASLPDFDPEKLEYDYVVPFGSATPTVTASYDNTKMTANIVQASSVPGSATITLTAINGIGTNMYKVNFTRGANPSQAAAYRATPTNYLDPNDPVWAMAQEIAVNKRSTTDASPTMQASGKAKVLWDDNYLYARVEVTKNYALNATGSSDHLRDSVELFFSERNFRGSYGSTVANGNQYRVNYLGATSQKTANSGWGGSGTVLDGLAEGQYGYVLTYRIPWADSSIPKAPGTVFGLDFQINAMQDASTRTCFAWSDGTDSGYNSSQYWGELVLAAQPAS